MKMSNSKNVHLSSKIIKVQDGQTKCNKVPLKNGITCAGTLLFRSDPESIRRGQ